MFVVDVAHFVTNDTPREFDLPWLRYCKVYEIEKYTFVVLTCGITSIHNFSDFRPSIHLLRNSKRSTSVVNGAD
jgi:hypothetical protein